MNDTNTITTSELLVIGYGNTLRRDDGVGPKVAEAVAALNLPGVLTLTCHQLTPELAEMISLADEVIFVDAADEAVGEVELRPIQSWDAGQIMAHATDPRSLLALARRIFGNCPPAWSLAVPVSDFNFGEQLSAKAQAGLDAALKRIRELANRFRAA